jgi:hypothetical protein
MAGFAALMVFLAVVLAGKLAEAGKRADAGAVQGGTLPVPAPRHSLPATAGIALSAAGTAAALVLCLFLLGAAITLAVFTFA